MREEILVSKGRCSGCHSVRRPPEKKFSERTTPEQKGRDDAGNGRHSEKRFRR